MKTALITLQNSIIAGERTQSVDARDLYSFLSIKDRYNTWIKRRIEEYGFKENQDFISFSENREKPKGGRPSIEYHLTLDMAKELAMVERNERGREARRYFIECEKQLRQQLLGEQKPIALPRPIRTAEDLSFVERNDVGHLDWWPYRTPLRDWSDNVEAGAQRFDEIRRFANHNAARARQALVFILHSQVADAISKCGIEYGFRQEVAAMVIRGIRCRDSAD